MSHLILLLLFQRLGDPFEPLFVRKLRPLFAKTIFYVFGGRLGETQKRLKSLKVAKSCILFATHIRVQLEEGLLFVVVPQLLGRLGLFWYI